MSWYNTYAFMVNVSFRRSILCAAVCEVPLSSGLIPTFKFSSSFVHVELHLWLTEFCRRDGQKAFQIFKNFNNLKTEDFQKWLE